MQRVKVEVINTAKEHKWRLVSGSEKSEWTGYYEGVLTHRFSDGRLIGYATDYWNGTLPVESPFEIVELKTIDRSNRIALLKDNQENYDHGFLTPEEYEAKKKKINEG